MNKDQFEELLLIHGGDPERWPAGDRADALAFVASGNEGQAMLKAARALDAAVLSASVVRPSGELAAVILGAVSRESERAAFDITPAGVAAAIAGSAGLTGAGYAIAAAIAATMIPDGVVETLSAILASGMPGGL